MWNWRCAAGAVALVVSAPAAQAQYRYNIVPIPPYGADRFNEAYDVNEAGEVAGATVDQQRRATFWDGRSPTPELLSTSPSESAALNDAGTAVGRYDVPNQRHGFTRAAGGSLVDVLPAGTAFATLEGVNNLGTVVGRAGADGNVNGPFIRRAGQPDVLLPYDGVARDVNESDVVVGTVGRSFEARAFMWDPVGGYRVLHGETDVLPLLSADAVNDAGYVTGLACRGGILESYLRSPTGEITRFLFEGRSSGLDVNNLNQVVGGGGFGTLDAYVWDPVRGAESLDALIDPRLGWDLELATGINDRGQIVGWGLLNGQQRAFLISPVPEPGAALGLCGALGCLLVRRRAGHRSRRAR